MIGLNSGQSLIFDFVTQQDLAQEITRGPSCVVLNGEYCIVGYGENLPTIVGQNAVGAWINNVYAATDHSSYAIKQQLRFKCKGQLKRDNSASTVKYRVRILKKGIPTGIEKSGAFESLGGTSVFEISNYLWYPQSFVFDVVRLEDGGLYSAQVKFEEWVNNAKIGETIWFSTGHVAKVAIKSPTLSVGLGQPIYTNYPTLKIDGLVHGDYSYVGLRKDLAYGTGSAGDIFSGNGSNIDITIPDATRTYSFSTVSYADKKFRIAVAAKDKYGNVMTVPALRDVCFDFTAPSLSWVSDTRQGNNIVFKASATDTGSGIKQSACVFKNKTHGISVQPTYLGQNVYQATVPIVEGQNTITFEAEDNAGNFKKIERVMAVDTTAPSLSCEEVVGKDINNIEKTLTFVDGMTVYGNSALLRFLIQDIVTGVKFVTLSFAGMSYPFNFQGQQAVTCEQQFNFSEGNNSISWEAEDVSGNISTGQILIKYLPYNASGPTITVTAPTFNSWQENSFMISGTIEDSDGVTSLRIDASLTDGGSVYKSQAATIIGNIWSATLSGLIDGIVYLSIIGIDAKGMSKTVKYKVRVDGVAPVMTTVNVIPATTNQSSFDIKTYAEELTSFLSRYVISVNGVEKLNYTFPANIRTNKLQPRIDVVQLSAGNNVVVASYFDSVNNEAQKTYNIFSTASLINFSINPVESSYISSTPFAFQLTAQSQENIQRIIVDYIPNKNSDEARVDDSGFYRLHDSTPFSISWNNSFNVTTGTPCINVSGSYGSSLQALHFPTAKTVVKVTAQTSAGSESAYFGFTMATDANRPRVISVSPSDGSTGISASAQIKVTFSEPMNTQASLAAISMSPLTTGEWYWSSGNTVAEFFHTTPFAGNSVNLTISNTAKNVAGQFLDTSYYSSFTISQQPRVERVTPTDGAGLNDVIEITFSTLMQEASLNNVILKRYGGTSISCDYTVLESSGKTVLRLQPFVALAYSTKYEVVVPYSVQSVYGKNISEHRHNFTTKASGNVSEQQGATVLLLPGLNGVSLPMFNSEITDEQKLRNYIDAQVNGSVGAIFRYDSQLKRWVARLSGSSGKAFAFGESVILSMNVNSAQLVRFVGTPHENGKNIAINAGLNCISLPKRVSGIDKTKELAAYMASQMGLSQLPIYLIRKKGSNTSKTAVGYAYRLPITHDGLYLESAEESLGGDAIIVISPKSGVLKFSGDSWEN